MRDGELDVFVIKDSRADTIVSALIDASPLDLPWADMPHWRARDIHIDADKKDYVFSFDGDNQVSLPVDVKARPGSLKVIVPVNRDK